MNVVLFLNVELGAGGRAGGLTIHRLSKTRPVSSPVTGGPARTWMHFSFVRGGRTLRSINLASLYDSLPRVSHTDDKSGRLAFESRSTSPSAEYVSFFPPPPTKQPRCINRRAAHYQFNCYKVRYVSAFLEYRCTPCRGVESADDRSGNL